MKFLIFAFVCGWTMISATELGIIDPLDNVDRLSSNTRPIRVADEFQSQGSKDTAMKEAERLINKFWRNFGQPLTMINVETEIEVEEPDSKNDDEKEDAAEKIESPKEQQVRDVNVEENPFRDESESISENEESSLENSQKSETDGVSGASSRAASSHRESISPVERERQNPSPSRLTPPQKYPQQYFPRPNSFSPTSIGTVYQPYFQPGYSSNTFPVYQHSTFPGIYIPPGSYYRSIPNYQLVSENMDVSGQPPYPGVSVSMPYLHPSAIPAPQRFMLQQPS